MSIEYKILLTGGDGQLAKSYARMYDSAYIANKDTFNITNVEHFKSYIKKHGEPEVIINCAAMTDVDRAERNPELVNEINAFALNNMLSHFSGLFIQISTDYVFDGKIGNYSSTDITKPVNAYGLSKALGETIVKENSNNWVIIRAGGLFSNLTQNNFYSWVVNALKKNEVINVVTDQIFNPVSTFDVAQYIKDIQMNNSMRNKIYHIGSNKNVSKYDFAIIIAKICGLNHEKIKPISTAELSDINSNYIAKRPNNSSLSLSNEGDRVCDLGHSVEFLKKY